MKIDISQLSHVYPTGDVALREINLTLTGTEPVAIIGQNGAGKTTFVKHLNGLLRPSAGTILLDGESIAQHTTAYWSRKVGYVFQNPDNQLFLESVRKELEFGPKEQGVPKETINERIQQVAKLTGLEGKLDDHPFDLNATDKKFCTIASVMMMAPEVVILDEPTCGQDLEGNRLLAEIIRYLSEQGTLCITITHDMKFVVRNFERIIVMAKGRILKIGSRKEIFSDNEILAKSFVTAPPITRLGQALGLEQPVFSKEEFIAAYRKRVVAS